MIAYNHTMRKGEMRENVDSAGEPGLEFIGVFTRRQRMESTRKNEALSVNEKSRHFSGLLAVIA